MHSTYGPFHAGALTSHTRHCNVRVRLPVQQQCPPHWRRAVDCHLVAAVAGTVP